MRWQPRVKMEGSDEEDDEETYPDSRGVYTVQTLERMLLNFFRGKCFARDRESM